MEGLRYKRKLDEDERVIKELKDQLKKSLAKGQEFVEQLNASHNYIDKLLKASGSEDYEATLEAMTKENEQLHKDKKNLKRAIEAQSIKMCEEMEAR